ncbi:hypothetical protein IWZ03DRAFT_443321 [Phyllosticta citriasiana]|uniref:Uncharacterized protein n=1 Tax=Phyllosticta citriasiana TaxID=595635 RepID=A0ABR1KH47_9PEZI
MDSDRTYYEIEESSNDAQNGSPDDRAIYRALARQILGDPQNFKYILNEVLHHYLQTWFNQKRALHQTLILEDTGEDLIKYMANFKAHEDSKQLNIKEVKWWWDPADPFNKFTRANEFESVVFSNFVVSVKTPDQIQPALNLLFNILPLIPGQKIPVNGILSIAVDRHATFCFYILDMLEKARKDTVSGLKQLWIRVIFNKKLLKIRFNFQSDISTLDNTIDDWIYPILNHLKDAGNRFIYQNLPPDFKDLDDRFELAEGMTEEPNISDRCKPTAVQGMECHMEDIFWRVRALKASESDILRGLLQDCKNVDGFSVSHGVRMAVEGDKMLIRKTEYPNTVGEYPPTAIQRALDDADTTSLTTDLSPEGRIRRLSELKDTLHKVIWSNRVKIDNCFDKWGLKFFARVEKILKFKGQVWTSDFEEAFNGPDPTISFEDPTTTPSRTRNGAVYGNGGSAGSKRSTEDAGLHRHDNPVSTKRIKR